MLYLEFRIVYAGTKDVYFVTGALVNLAILGGVL